MTGSSRARVLFMGSPEFAVPTLRALHEHHDVVAVVTQPDRPKGRGRSLASPPIKTVAEQLGIEVLQPPTLRKRSVREQLTACGAQFFVVAAFGQIIRPKMLAVPPLGCINVHASLLPRHRGAAPIQWAVLSGDRESGVTIMMMDAGVDTGPVLLEKAIELRADETAGSLHDRLAPLGARALIEAIAGLRSGELAPRAQDEKFATSAPMLSKEDGRVDFAKDAARVDCWIRGMDPWPGAFTELGEERLKLYGSAMAEEGHAGGPGEVLAVDDRGLLAACGAGAVWIRELQLPGRRRMRASDLMAGNPIPLGTVLGHVR